MNEHGDVTLINWQWATALGMFVGPVVPESWRLDFAPPIMFVGLLLRDYFTTDWQLLPSRGFKSEDFESLTTLGKIGDVASHVTLPLIALTIGSLAYYSRFMKSGLLEVIRADYIRTFASHVSHEFKTPLTTIRGSAELLREHLHEMSDGFVAERVIALDEQTGEVLWTFPEADRDRAR